MARCKALTGSAVEGLTCLLLQVLCLCSDKVDHICQTYLHCATVRFDLINNKNTEFHINL